MHPLVIVLFVFLVAFLFYGLIPGIGAFTVRARWRSFRRRIIEASMFPFLHYGSISKEDKLLGSHRVFGDLEAIQGKNLIWIDTGELTVEVDLEGIAIYLLPSYSTGDENMPFEWLEEILPDEEPISVRWNQIFSLPAGTKFFVGGPLYCEQGRGVFRAMPKEQLTVVIYDGDKKSILMRSIWGGRKRNEYWNRFTMVSLLAGSVSLLLFAYVLLRTPLFRLPSIMALSLSFFPFAALLPPGVCFYFLYRYFWKRARLLRAERDLIRLPVRYFENLPQDSIIDAKYSTITLPTGEHYIMTNRSDFLIKGELIIRGGRLPHIAEEKRGDYCLFGALAQDRNSRTIIEPEDPMAELILTLGNPQHLAQVCSTRAKLFEALSAVLIFAGIGLNLFLIFVAWNNLIR